MLAWKIAPALATGNTVVLKPAEFTPLTALVFAELCQEAGLPAGVVNIVTGDGSTGEALVKHPDVDKIAFTGSTEVGRAIRSATASSHKRLSLELGGKSPFIIFEDADLDSAVEGLVDGIWFNQGQVCCAGSRLLMQESIAEPLISKIRDRMSTLRIGAPLDKAIDIGAIVARVQLDRIERMVAQGVAEGATCWQPQVALPSRGFYYPPTLLSNVHPTSIVAQQEIFGPVLAAMTFRTPKRSRRTGQQYRLRPGFVRVEREHQRGASCRRATQSRRCLGELHESLRRRLRLRRIPRERIRPRRRPRRLARIHGAHLVQACSEHLPAAKALTRRPESQTNNPEASAPTIDRTVKLYIGGKQARPDSGYSMEVRSPDGQLLGEAGLGNRKDIRNAVEAARKAECMGESDCAQSRPGLVLLRREPRPASERNRPSTRRSRSVKSKRRQKSNSASSASSPTRLGPTSSTAPFTILRSAISQSQ